MESGTDAASLGSSGAVGQWFTPKAWGMADGGLYDDARWIDAGIMLPWPGRRVLVYGMCGWNHGEPRQDFAYCQRNRLDEWMWYGSTWLAPVSVGYAVARWRGPLGNPDIPPITLPDPIWTLDRADRIRRPDLYLER